MRHVDDRGWLYEVIHITDSFLPKFGQTYLVGNPARSAIRGFHKHRALWDYFCIVKGSAKFVLVVADEEEVMEAARKGSVMGPDALETYVLSALRPQLLVVPAGVWHGWMSLEDETMLLSTASEVYNPQQPDEVRAPSAIFGDVWTVAGR
jgi:dTDP-4-dehydrorhamnose 3,5-epimerase-like enzyme